MAWLQNPEGLFWMSETTFSKPATIKKNPHVLQDCRIKGVTPPHCQTPNSNGWPPAAQTYHLHQPSISPGKRIEVFSSHVSLPHFPSSSLLLLLSSSSSSSCSICDQPGFPAYKRRTQISKWVGRYQEALYPTSQPCLQDIQ